MKGAFDKLLAERGRSTKQRSGTQPRAKSPAPSNSSSSEDEPQNTPAGSSDKSDKMSDGAAAAAGDKVEDTAAKPADDAKPADGSTAEAKVIEEAVQVGMTCDFKNLYSGKEDRKGRFQWQDKIPDDIGEPVENAETAKFALLVRNVKVYNDPRKVLAIHSIVIQSPLLKKLLKPVLEGYPGITSSLKRLELSGKFEPLIHRWSRLKEAIAKIGDSTDEEKETKKHADLFYSIVQKEFAEDIDSCQDMIAKGVITYEYLWQIYAPGSVIYGKRDGQDIALKLFSTRYGTNNNGKPVFWVTGKYVDWDGTQMGFNKLNLSIPQFTGTRKISSLTAVPMDFLTDKDAMVKKLTERGVRFEAMAGVRYVSYSGFAWKRAMFGGRDKYHIKGRVVIDSNGFNRFSCNEGVYLNPLWTKERAEDGDGASDQDNDEGMDDDDGEDNGMPYEGEFLEDDNPYGAVTLTDEQRLITTPVVRGYSLSNKMWLNMFLNNVADINFSDGAFDKLILPAQQRELILGFTESQNEHKDQFDDIIEGKGRGIVMLLSGKPGVGKTLTAEAIAEQMKVPLYMMSAGELGLDPSRVEEKLKDILELCSKWHSILLIDEGDVFLEERSLHELERNKLVSIFLRLLEYYEGILILTTNRVETIDKAFQSRIHISLEYPDLSTDSRLKIWQNFLAAATLEVRLTVAQVAELARLPLNGRQIKNVLKTAQLLARRKTGEDSYLSMEHVKTVLDVTQHLHHSTQETERTRAAIYT